MAQTSKQREELSSVEENLKFISFLQTDSVLFANLSVVAATYRDCKELTERPTNCASGQRLEYIHSERR